MKNRIAKRIAISAAIYGIVLFGVTGALVGFGSVHAPRVFASITDPFAKMDRTGLPPLERYKARDGVELSFRSYKAGGDQVAVLIHGSAGSSADMHAMAHALADAGVTVFVPDLRGHGANFPHGDVSYTGQLDDDMSDFLQAMRPNLPDACWTLVGFSSGGGFALRVSGGGRGREFDRYILLSPFLKYDAPTVRPPSQETTAPTQAWYDVSVKRIVGLSIFNFFGIHAFDGLPVLAFAVPPEIESVTATYSFRMEKSFAPHSDYRADIRAVPRPMQVFVGGRDELFLPEKFGEVFGAERREIPVTILPGMGHSDMITKPEAISAVVAAFHAKARLCDPKTRSEVRVWTAS
jgi:pimeloyl-ACP methyl ester carboxylesterase